MILLHKLAKTSFLALGLSVLTISAMATQFSHVGGGSSAMMGDFRQSSNYRPGALPRSIEQLGAIAGYKTAADSDFNNILTITNVTIQGTVGPAFTETANDVQIRYVKVGANNYNIVIFVRTDSGFGVRYVANKAKITAIPGSVFRVIRTPGGEGLPINNNQGAGAVPSTFGFSNVDTSTVGTDQATAVTQDDKNVLQFLRDQITAGGISIETGYTDVAAQTVADYAGFAGLNTAGLADATSNSLPVLTLLLMYNGGIHAATGSDFALSINRTQAKNLWIGLPGSAFTAAEPPISFGQIDPRIGQWEGSNAKKIIARAAYRENTSGTRLTHFTNVLREGTSGTAVFENSAVANGYPGIESPFAIFGGAAVANPQTGTGAMMGTIGAGFIPATPEKGAAFGYSFVTGTVGNSRPNHRVALYNGVAPYRRDPSLVTYPTEQIGDQAPITGSGTSLFLPNNGGQPDYVSVANTGKPYYSETVFGRYELWSNAIQLVLTASPRKATADALAAALNSGSPQVQKIVNGLGFVQQSQMQATRAGFTASSGEFVTDGTLIIFETNFIGIPASGYLN